MLIQEIMIKDVVDIDCNDSVFNACMKYREFKVGCLVVMDKDMIVGIITERDIIERSILADRNPRETRVRDVMSTNIKTIHAMAPVDKAADMMKEYNIKKLPVILNNEIVGIITETDLSRTIHTYSDTITDLIQFYEGSKEKIEKMMNDWGDLMSNLKGYKTSSNDRERPKIEI